MVGALVENHRRFLAFVERRAGSRAEAEDILQGAFVRGIERSGSIRDRESAVAWFYRLLPNTLVDHYRHSGAESRVFSGEVAEGQRRPVAAHATTPRGVAGRGWVVEAGSERRGRPVAATRYNQGRVSTDRKRPRQPSLSCGPTRRGYLIRPSPCTASF